MTLRLLIIDKSVRRYWYILKMMVVMTKICYNLKIAILLTEVCKVLELTLLSCQQLYKLLFLLR